MASAAAREFELRDLLAIEGDAVFGAIEIERGLPEQVLRLAQLGIELVGAALRRSCSASSSCTDCDSRSSAASISRSRFSRRAASISRCSALLASTMRSRPAHLFAQLGVAPRLRCLALQRSKLLFDFDENVVDARKIDLRGFELRFRQAPLGLVHRDAGGFFDDGAAVHRLRVQDLADAALLDDGVAVRARGRCP